MLSNIAIILDALLSAIKNHVSLLYSMPRKHGVTQGITPTEGESVFESYLSVLTHLLGTQEIYENIVDEFSDVVRVQEVTGKDSIPTLKKTLSILSFIVINQIRRMVMMVMMVMMAQRTIASTPTKRTRVRVVKIPSSGK